MRINITRGHNAYRLRVANNHSRMKESNWRIHLLAAARAATHTSGAATASATGPVPLRYTWYDIRWFLSSRSVWFEMACSQDMVGGPPLLVVVYAPGEVSSTPSSANSTDAHYKVNGPWSNPSVMPSVSFFLLYIYICMGLVRLVLLSLLS